MTPRATTLGFCLIALLAAGTIVWLTRETAPHDPVAPSPAPPPTVPAPPRPEAPVLTYGAPKAVRAPTTRDRRNLLSLPNGDFVPTLNGVLDAPPLSWPPEVPFSPIVGTERDTRGQEWYVHADGARSTTSMVFRSDEGRLAPVTSLALPKPAGAIEDGR